MHITNMLTSQQQKKPLSINAFFSILNKKNAVFESNQNATFLFSLLISAIV